MQNHFPVLPWEITENGFDGAYLRESESLFTLSNGLIGMRGNLDEQTASGAQTVQGTFLNGVFDTEPIVYGEAAYGYAKNHETICSVMDAKGLVLVADGERLDLGASRVTDHRRTLDLRAGVLRRSFRWETAGGCALDVETRRLVSLTRQNLAAVRLRVRCVRGGCALEIRSAISPAVIAAGDPDDPRAASGKDRTLLCERASADGTLLSMRQRTKRSGFAIDCAAEHRGKIPFETACGADRAEWTGRAALAEGDEIVLEKSICYTAARYAEPEDARAICHAAPDFAALEAEQREVLDAFWADAGLGIDGDDALLQGLRFNLFHLLQAAGRDGLRSVAAKGLSGEGYEGHYFWDTEAYMLPVFLYTHPAVARKLLEYRHATLPKARERARVMGHARGALYPWRTIDGEECSAYFPAGTAQYHINGDIAHAVREYWLATEDLDFLAQCGAEMLVETARVYLDLGFFSPEKDGRFVLNCVTGPDEYNVMVNNNVYTNCVAEENLRSAAAAMDLLRERRPEDYRRLCAEIGWTDEEGAAFLEAAERMYYPAARDGVVPQDDGFLERRPWPLDTIPEEKRPLLLHWHGLTIYRSMVCKQADLILAMTRFGSRWTAEEKRRSFDFYDSVTTHDSSLSMAVFSILACEIGEIDTAYDYFMASARLDLDNVQKNTKDGLHMANMAGAWNCITAGFGGMRVQDGTLCFAPVCPPQWNGFSFRVVFRGRCIEVRARRGGAEYELVRGAPIEIRSYGAPVALA